MRKICFIALLVFLPGIAYGSVASDFTVNRQSTYDIPYGTERVLILDLTLPIPATGETYQLESITLHNAGTADHTVVSELEVWEDGASAGWNGDERSVVRVTNLLFFDAEISGDFRAYSQADPWQRLFVTVDLKSNFINEKTFQLQLLKGSVVFTNSAVTGPTDAVVMRPFRLYR